MQRASTKYQDCISESTADRMADDDGDKTTSINGKDKLPTIGGTAELSKDQPSPIKRSTSSSKLIKTTTYLTKVVRRANIGGFVRNMIASTRWSPLPFVRRRSTSKSTHATTCSSSTMTEEQYQEHLDAILKSATLDSQSIEKLPPEYVIYQHHRYDFIYDDKPWSEEKDNVYQQLLGGSNKPALG